MDRPILYVNAWHHMSGAVIAPGFFLTQQFRNNEMTAQLVYNLIYRISDSSFAENPENQFTYNTREDKS